MSLDNITDNKNIPTCEEILRSELFSARLSNLSPLASMLSMVYAANIKIKSIN